MKRLFLASSFDDVAPLLTQFVHDDVTGKTVTFIPTASMYEEVNFYVDAAKDAFHALGMIIDVLDVSTANLDEIRYKLAANDYIYVSGGNTFFLLQELIKSGADKLIIEQVNAGKPYIGESAGSIIVSPNIEYVKEMDNPDDPNVAKTLRHYDALNLVNFYPIPHYTNYPFEDITEAMIEKYRSQLVLYPITNFQVIVVNGDSVEILGTESSAN